MILLCSILYNLGMGVKHWVLGWVQRLGTTVGARGRLLMKWGSGVLDLLVLGLEGLSSLWVFLAWTWADSYSAGYC